MTTAYIFSGPTLPNFKIEEHFGCKLNNNDELHLTSGEIIKFLPPVAEGDILKLLPLKPKIIGIIDGYFENVPSVWHKEILYAMSKGIHILGASSMGALRAAELKAFGMEGIGAVFQAFADGLLEDDDEVTIAHGPEKLGFPMLSEAMVNIRRTLDDARNENILSAANHTDLLSIAKKLHYKERSYGKILSLTKNNDTNKFKDWLKDNRKDQKLEDALKLLDTISTRLNNNIDKKTVLYDFKNTIIWHQARTPIKEAI